MSDEEQEPRAALQPAPTDPVGIDRLRAVMRILRDPVNGCPWDLEQSFETIAPYTVEEAYEVAEAIADGDLVQIKDELGDLLLQVVYHAQIASEAGAFTFDDVAHANAAKMVRRHPHVFEQAQDALGVVETPRPEAVSGQWEAQKEAERRESAAAKGHVPSVLDGVGVALPALMRAEKLQKRAARVGFDWGAAAPVLAKIREELGELEAELADADPVRLQDELGDLLFACTNLARHLDVDPETALRATNRKFEKRFHFIETVLAENGRSPKDASLDEMEALWNEAKQQEATRR